MEECASSSTNVVPTHVMQVAVEPEADENLDKVVQKFWKLDSIGILDENTLEQFKENIGFHGLRYFILFITTKDNRKIYSIACVAT